MKRYIVRVLPQDWLWILGELALGTGVCAVPILYSGSLTDQSLKLGIVLATVLLLLTEGIRQFVGVSKVGQFFRDLTSAFEGLVQLRALNTYSKLIQIDAQIERLTDELTSLRERRLVEAKELANVLEQLSRVRQVVSDSTSKSTEFIQLWRDSENRHFSEMLLAHISSLSTDVNTRFEKAEYRMRDAISASLSDERSEILRAVAHFSESQQKQQSEILYTIAKIEARLDEIGNARSQEVENLVDAVRRIRVTQSPTEISFAYPDSSQEYTPHLSIVPSRQNLGSSIKESWDWFNDPVLYRSHFGDVGMSAAHHHYALIKGVSLSDPSFKGVLVAEISAKLAIAGAHRPDLLYILFWLPSLLSSEIGNLPPELGQEFRRQLWERWRHELQGR